MGLTRADQRFFATTRGQIVSLLRRASRTVNDLAHALDLTDNAVRAHLATLERDGLVEQRGLRRGSGKPAYAYHLTPAAERLFPRAYGALMAHLLDVLQERLAPETLLEVLRDVGRRVAAGGPVPTGGQRARVEYAVALLNDLGGLAECEERDGMLLLRGYSCPLAAVVSAHPQACEIARALLESIVGGPVEERCEQGERPRCSFAIPGAAPGGGAS